MLFAHVKAAHASLSFDNVVWEGADEVNRRKKGHKYLTVFADLVAKRVFFATPGKDVSVWEAFTGDLLQHNGYPKVIRYAAIDMSAAYTKGVNENLGNDRAVYDKFHVTQNVVQACDQVWKAEMRDYAEKRDWMEQTRWMCLRTGSTGRRRKPKIRVDGLGKVCDGHSLRDEAGASRHLRVEGRRGR